MGKKKIFTAVYKSISGLIVTSLQRKRYVQITPQQLFDLIGSGEKITIVDYRYEDDFKKGHIEGAINVPFTEFSRNIKSIPREYPVVSICYVGAVGKITAQTLAKKGYSSSMNVYGGIKAWEKAKYPIFKPDNSVIG